MQRDIKQPETKEKDEQQPVSAEHEFYESLAATPQSYEDDYDRMVEEEAEPTLMPTWAILAFLVVGFVLILALLLALGIG